MTDQYAVMGNPISHSKSPDIHRLFAEQTHQDLSYEAILGPLKGFIGAVAAFANIGGKGLNVTVPFKNDAYQLAKYHTGRAQRANAVNTLTRLEDKSWQGDNTDGVGLVRDLSRNLGIHLQGRRVLVLGAGGAVQGVLGPLLDGRPDLVHIANRTEVKAQNLASLFASSGNTHASSWAGLRGERFDLVINGTSASLAGELPPLPDRLLADGAEVYDMMYSKQATPFMKWANDRGAKASHDGLGMLVEQAAESFQVWRGVLPDAAPVIAQLRRSL